MYDFVTSINLPPKFSSRIRKLGFTTCLRLPKHVKCSVNESDWRSNRVNSRDLGLREKEKIRELGVSRDNEGWKDESEMEGPVAESGIDDSVEVFKFRATEKDYKLVKEDDIDSEMEGLEIKNYRRTIDAAKSRRQMMRRSNVMAKQVISIRSALSLGFVTQLWVDTDSRLETANSAVAGSQRALESFSDRGRPVVAEDVNSIEIRGCEWVVMVVEVKPSLLSGDSERFLLKEITQVGDVMLIEDEIVMEDDIKLVGLETLVGYTVTTPRGQTIGKVRGYSFNINSGTLESLELDSFGISIIPSSLVSTYALLVDDVLEVFPDTIVARNAAVSRLQRLTKGFWDGQSAGNSNKEFQGQREDYAEDYSERPRKSQKSRRNKRKSGDDLELPMDFL